MAMIKIIPPVSMFHTPVRVLASGLSAGQRVVLACNIRNDETGADYSAEAKYVANAVGEVDCQQSAAVGGSFTGVNPMGLFWSLKPTPKMKAGSRFLPISATTPMRYSFTLKDDREHRILSQCTSDKYFLHPQVRRQEVNSGRLRGTLFVPTTLPDQPERKLPAIIDLYGTRGGLSELRASLLASHGFITLALAYFNYKDLPTSFDDLELEYFDEAIQMLLKHPCAMDDGVGVMGMSFGAELAFIMASYLPKVKAVVGINGLHVLDSFNPINYKGKTLPIVSGDMSTLEFVDEHLHYVSYRSKLPSDPEFVFPIEKSDAQFLFLASEDDRSTPAVQSFKILMQRLREHGKEKQGELLTLPGAGHLLEPPYSPHTASLFHKVVGAQMAFGGEPIAHAAAQELAWEKIRRFFAQYLGPPLTLKAMHEIIGHSKL